MLKPAFDATDGVDGRVSIEVAPAARPRRRSHHREAKKLWAEVDRQNLFIKIPATTEGAPAITEVLGAGISVNVTLIFGLDRYDAVMDAYLEGLEKAKANGKDLSKIHSVASFFVSRVDTEIDKRLGQSGDPQAGNLMGSPASPTPGWPTRPTRRSSRATGSRRSRPTAPTPSGRCGPRPA